MMVASISPARVPMGTPARGPRPIVVSTHLPSTMAAREEPLPRWQEMSFSPLGSRPMTAAARADT